MKLLIRYLGLVVIEKKLAPGAYTIGRALDNDILLTPDFISRKHGRLFYSDEKWIYQDLRKGHPRYNPLPYELKMHQMIELENDIDLMFEEYCKKEIPNYTKLIISKAWQRIRPITVNASNWFLRLC